MAVEAPVKALLIGTGDDAADVCLPSPPFFSSVDPVLSEVSIGSGVDSDKRKAVYSPGCDAL
jgi:hypothetical protein